MDCGAAENGSQIDNLKIDSRFVRDLGPDTDIAHVVRAIIALVHASK